MRVVLGCSARAVLVLVGCSGVASHRGNLTCDDRFYGEGGSTLDSVPCGWTFNTQRYFDDHAWLSIGTMGWKEEQLGKLMLHNKMGEMLLEVCRRLGTGVCDVQALCRGGEALKQDLHEMELHIGSFLASGRAPFFNVGIFMQYISDYLHSVSEFYASFCTKEVLAMAGSSVQWVCNTFAIDMCYHSARRIANTTKCLESWLSFQRACKQDGDGVWDLDVADAAPKSANPLSQKFVPQIRFENRLWSGERLPGYREVLKNLIGLLLFSKRTQHLLSDAEFLQPGTPLAEISRTALAIQDGILVNMVEVGVYKGATSKFLLGEAPQLHLIGVDPYPEVQHDGMGREDFLAPTGTFEAVRQDFAQFGGRAQLLRSTGPQAAPIIRSVMATGVDLLFIDGEHSYDAVKMDLTSLEPLVRQGGVVAFHDFHLPQVRKAIHERGMGRLHVGPENICWFFRM